MPTNAIIEERGNGWPHAGHYVPGDDGQLYRVEALIGPIHTGHAGHANYIHARVELADWTDCSEQEEFPALAVVRQSAGEED